jgi:A/G-specific adenine glycosylase
VSPTGSLQQRRPGRRSKSSAAATVTLSRAAVATFGRKLRAWYRANARDLPWRRTRDPYHVLVSELMLQQTQVSRVVPRYHEFLERYPTLADVARSSPRQVREAWDGLGYYARARNLRRVARSITANGREPGRTLPADPAALRALPGIGPYTAGAVASFAFERRAPLVDTNVARVLRRVFAPQADPKSGAGRGVLWQLATALLPRTGRAVWTHNQALMELGALVCRARKPTCAECPVRSVCKSGLWVARIENGKLKTDKGPRDAMGAPV